MDVQVTDNPGESRFEATFGNEFAGVAVYRRSPGRISFLHTEVEEAFEGMGVGSALASEALGAARAEGLEVMPFCPFIRRYIAEHREYLDLSPRPSEGGSSYEDDLGGALRYELRARAQRGSGG